MAMRFSQAGRAETPDILQATVEQGRIAAALRQAEMQQRQGNMSAAAQFGQMAPEGSWGNLGNAMMGENAAAPIYESVGVPGAGAAGAEGAALGTAGAEGAALGAAGAEGAALGTAAGGGAAAGAGTVAGAAPTVAATTTGGAGLAGGATGGMSGALAGLGPWGWAALAALALSSQ